MIYKVQRGETDSEQRLGPGAPFDGLEKRSKAFQDSQELESMRESGLMSSPHDQDKKQVPDREEASGAAVTAYEDRAEHDTERPDAQWQLNEYRARLSNEMEKREVRQRGLAGLGPSMQQPVSAMDESERPVRPGASQAISGQTTASTESAGTMRRLCVHGRTARRPSYPFSRTGAFSRLDKPWTTLSPTIPPGAAPDSCHIQDGVVSSLSTPASTVTFQPRKAANAGETRQLFPAPSLYDLVLKLTAEPGLEAWWKTVVQIMTELYHADRISLSVPADPTDIGNVTWGQKASFDVHQSDQSKGSTPGFAEMHWRDNEQAKRKWRTRPGIHSRHSFTSYEDKRGWAEEKRTTSPERAGLVAGSVSFFATPVPVTARALSLAGLGQGTLAEDDDQKDQLADGFASWETPLLAQTEVCGKVLEGLQALDHEADPLIDASGVERVIKRGKVIALTRSCAYMDEQTAEERPGDSNAVESGRKRSDKTARLGTFLGNARPAARLAKGYHVAGQRGGRFDDEDRRRHVTARFEEYEQAPSSPWSQSPAASPAVRNDVDENPFFADATVNEGSFNPLPIQHDYGAMQPSEAIGVDRSWTVLHIPLNHILLSKSGPAVDAPALPPDDADAAPAEKQRPIAILSMLSPIIPYPCSLQHSLEYLAPHLATSFSLSRHYSNLETESKGLPRRQAANKGFGIRDAEARRWLDAADLASLHYMPGEDSFQVSMDRSINSSRHGSDSPSDSRIDPACLTDSCFSSTIGGKNRQLHSYASASTRSLMSRGVTQPQPRTRSGSTSPMTQPPMRPPSDTLKSLILDSLPMHVFVAVPQSGELVWVNSRFLAYRGQTAEQLAADPWGSIHADECHGYLQAWAWSVRTGEQFSRTARIRRFDGEYRWFYARAVASRDSRGAIHHFIGSYMDIHDQHLAELKSARQEEIEASEAKHRLLANLIPQIIFTATEGDGILFANEQWLAYTGEHDFGHAMGLGFIDFVHADDLAKCRIPAETRSPTAKSSDLPTSNLSELARKGAIKISKDSYGRQSYTTEIRLRSKTGEYRWHLIRCVETDKAKLGSSGQYFGSATDINDLKLLETKLKEAMESKSRFLSNMSHEMRTPLIGISGMVAFLQDTRLNEEQRDYTNTIQTSANSLLMIINDILDLSKVDAGMMKLKHEWFHTRSLIEDVNELVYGMAIAKRLELNYVVEEDVPAWIKGDRVRIRQILLNVIGNAIKFTSQGEVFSRCRVVPADGKATRSEITLEFSIVDTGRGFTKDEADLIFKPFSQIDGSSTRQHGGSGLGLVISRQLAELHGGRIEGTAVLNEGSTFTFTARFGLPTEADHPEAPPSPSSTPVTSAQTTKKSGSGAVSGTAGAVTKQSPFKMGLVYLSEAARVRGQDLSQMRLEMPSGQSSLGTTPTPAAGTFRSTVYSILVICPQTHSREATIKHIEMTLPKEVGHHITATASVREVQALLGADDPILFSHMVINLPSPDEIISLVAQVARSKGGAQVVMLILSDLVQRQALLRQVAGTAHEAMFSEQHVTYIYKPIKPSRFAVIFDPQRERDISIDRNRFSAQRLVETQKQAYQEMEKRIGHKGHKVLLVEDNAVNQKVLQKYLKRIGLAVEVAADGVECTDQVFAHSHDYYSLVLCDLYMPRKDGYQACREVRDWEAANKFPTKLPIVALSANVMSEVPGKCVDAGFDDYLTKPIDFVDLNNSLAKYF